MTKQQLEKYKKEVKERIGSTVSTLWGPCTVLGLVYDEEDKKDYVELSEDGEKFTVVLDQWESMQQ